MVVRSLNTFGMDRERSTYCGRSEFVGWICRDYWYRRYRSKPAAKEVAEEVTDFAKCVSVVGSAVEVVVMFATLTEMGTEMKRDKVEWPRIQFRVKHLHAVVLVCMSHVLNPGAHINELQVKNILKVQQEPV